MATRSFRNIIALFIVIAILIFFSVSGQADDSISMISMVIPYKDVGKYTIEMVYENSALHLRILMPSTDDKGHKEAIELLKNEILYLTNSHEPVELIEYGYTFCWEGGYPIWGPYTARGSDYRYECIKFCENAELLDKQIIAYGTKTKEGYWGYEKYDPNKPLPEDK